MARQEPEALSALRGTKKGVGPATPRVLGSKGLAEAERTRGASRPSADTSPSWEFPAGWCATPRRLRQASGEDGAGGGIEVVDKDDVGGEEPDAIPAEILSSASAAKGMGEE